MIYNIMHHDLITANFMQAKEKLKQLNAVNGENDKKKMELEVRLENEREAYAHKEVELNSIKVGLEFDLFSTLINFVIYS